jgi:hypothetical protein
VIFRRVPARRRRSLEAALVIEVKRVRMKD